MKDNLGRLLMNWRIQTVLPHMKGDVMDMGCGTNELLIEYTRLNPQTKSVGVDVHQWGNVDIVIEDAAALPLDDAIFDTVTCIAALNHIPNRDEFLAEAHRILRPGGRFVMTMIPPAISRVWHFIRSPWDADQHERGMEEEEEYGFNRASVHRMLAGAEFEMEQEKSFMLGINTLYAAHRK